MAYIPATAFSPIQSIGAATTKVAAIFQRHDIPFYVFAGFALYLHGLENSVRDSDIRVLHPDLQRIVDILQPELSGATIHTLHMRPYHDGSYTYLNDRIDIVYDSAEIDICSRMSVACDLGGVFSYPYGKAAFEDVVYLPYGDAMLPVASLEFLLLYYLVLRRGPADEKADELRIRTILASGRLNNAKFLALLDASSHAAQLNALYTERLRNIQR